MDGSDGLRPEVGLIRTSDTRLSYKFQRLREQLRQAIASGELAGKLPGERELSRRFSVNAKTLGKALTDLAAEGILERAVGRGTFVRGSEPAASAEKWLIACPPESVDSPVCRALLGLCPNAEFLTHAQPVRPGFLNAFSAVIDVAQTLPDEIIRNAIVRGLTVVRFGSEPTLLSTHAVLADTLLGAQCLAREMMLLGHRRFVTIDARQPLAAEGVRIAALRYAPDSAVESGAVMQLEQFRLRGFTAVICNTRRSAIAAFAELKRLGVSIPGEVSLAAVGTGEGDWPCNGYFINAAQAAETIAELLRQPASQRPTTVWLTGQHQDLGTVSAVPPAAAHAAAG